MRYIVSYSGGMGSAITAQMVADKYGLKNTILLFADTLIEDEDLYRFNRDLLNKFNFNFIRIAEGRTPWEVFKDVKFIGNSRIDPCSKILKRDFIRKFLKVHYKPSDIEIFVGIDATESHRLPPIIERNKPYEYRSLLIEENVFIDYEFKKAWCDRYGIKIPRLYEMGMAHNNCGGFCIKAGLGQFKKLYENLPETYLKNEREEELAMQQNPNLRPFLKKMIKGQIKYITLREYREKYLEHITEDEALDFGGCGCALE